MGNAEADAARKPWTISDSEIPAVGEAGDLIRFLIRYAILAPSGHNTQPWLFRVRDRSVELRADRARALPVVDPDDRALIISCGAALATLRIVAFRFGYWPAVEVLPDSDDEDILARVSFEQGDPAGDDEMALFRAIPERRTTRHAFEDRDLPDHLAVLSPSAISSAIAARSCPRISSSQTPASRASATSRSHAESACRPSALLSVLGTGSDQPAAWLASGQALQRVLLRAAGVSSSFLNQPIETAALRPALADLIGRRSAYPQLLLRFGYGPEVDPEPRRGVEEF